MSDIIAQCYQNSVALLKTNANRYGLMAATPGRDARERRYINIFGRDACICALGMLASGDKKLIAIAGRSLATLAKFQTERGQIPYSVNPAKKETLFYYMGDKDSTLWWLIAMHNFRRKTGESVTDDDAGRTGRALEWLFYQDQNNCGLIEQCEAADWEDLMPDNGTVLYTNILWHKTLALYGRHREKNIAASGLANLFLPHEARIKDNKYFDKDVYRVKLLRILKESVAKRPYYLDYVSSFMGNDRFDALANILAIIFDVADKARAKKIIAFTLEHGVNEPRPVKALFPNIEPGDPDWRDYLKHRGLNLPYQYHNGGIWPFIGAFWAMALHRTGESKLAWTELERVAEANRVNGWQFNEWFHGQTGKAMGLPGQSWNAGVFLLAYQCLRDEFKI